MDSILIFFEQIDGNPYFICGGIIASIFFVFDEFILSLLIRRRGRRLYNNLLTDLKNECHNFVNFDSYVYLYIDQLSRFDKSCICDFLNRDKKNFYIDVCMIYILIDFDDRFKTKGV